MLWFHGDADAIIPFDDAKQAINYLSNVELILMRDESHLGGFTAADDVFDVPPVSPVIHRPRRLRLRHHYFRQSSQSAKVAAVTAFQQVQTRRQPSVDGFGSRASCN